MLERKIQQLVEKDIVKELEAIRLYMQNGMYIGYTQNPAEQEGAHEAIYKCSRCMRNNSREDLGTHERV